MIHLSPMPQSELALPVELIDETNPLILPPLQHRDPLQPAAGYPSTDGFSVSVPSAEGPLSGTAGRIGIPRPTEPGIPPPASPEPAAGCACSSLAENAPPLIPSFSLAAGQTTFAGMPVAAMEAVMAERMRQIVEFGHTPDKDLTLRPSVLPERAIRYLVNVKEDLQFRGPDHRARAGRHLAQAGAMVLAAIDWLDAGGGQ